MVSFPSIPVLNLSIHNTTLDELLAELSEGIVFTPNIDHLMKLQLDESFYRAYQQATYRLCDSRIIQLISRIGPIPSFQAQLAGSDVFPAFCRHHRTHTDQFRIFLLGGTESQAMEQLQARMNHGLAHPQIVGVYAPPFGFEQDPTANAHICHLVNQSGATVLAVGLGAPKQEIWITRHLAQLPHIQLYFAVGKTLDFMAGTAKRAPSWVSTLGFEWAYRLFQEPGRLAKRYLVEDLPFFRLLWKQWKGRYANPWQD